MKILLLISLIWLQACAPKTIQEVQPEISKDCKEAWVYAPASLIIELNLGNQVLLNPAVQEFPIFCSKNLAKEALDQEIEQKKLPAEGWAYYRLAGEYANLVKFSEHRALLKDQTSLVDFEK